MFIKESIKLAPYSTKLPCLLPFPGSNVFLSATAEEVCLFDEFGKKVTKSALCLNTPLQEISIHLDIERERVVIQGKDASGTFRKSFVLKEGKLLTDQKTPVKTFEKISLGCHKKQQIEKLLLKADVESCLPHLFALGAKAPKKEPLSKEALEFKNMLETGRKEETVSFIKQLLTQRCEGIFLPSSRISNSYAVGETSLSLWAELYPLIRSLFIRIQKGEAVSFLPNLPSDFHAGKMTEVSLEGEGTLHFVWSKKRLFKALFSINKPCSYRIDTRADEKKCRIRFGIRGEPKICEIGKTIEFKEPGLYFLDRLEK